MLSRPRLLISGLTGSYAAVEIYLGKMEMHLYKWKSLKAQASYDSGLSFEAPQLFALFSIEFQWINDEKLNL